jgi:hypothetical protein
MGKGKHYGSVDLGVDERDGKFYAVVHFSVEAKLRGWENHESEPFDTFAEAEAKVHEVAAMLDKKAFMERRKPA